MLEEGILVLMLYLCHIYSNIVNIMIKKGTVIFRFKKKLLIRFSGILYLKLWGKMNQHEFIQFRVLFMAVRNVVL